MTLNSCKSNFRIANCMVGMCDALSIVEMTLKKTRKHNSEPDARACGISSDILKSNFGVLDDRRSRTYWRKLMDVEAWSFRAEDRMLKGLEYLVALDGSCEIFGREFRWTNSTGAVTSRSWMF
jgi:hypothetical protein